MAAATSSSSSSSSVIVVAVGAVAATLVASAALLYRAQKRPRAPKAGPASDPPAVASTVVVSVATPRVIRRIAVYCGSSMPKPEFGGDAIVEQTKILGKLLAEKGIELVYGGGTVGIMGVLAKTVDENGGVVRGIIPKSLAPKEVSGGPVQPHNVEVVGSMHQRKKRMAELVDAFIALPGGFGTFEELAEVITWSQLGIHHKSVGILNAGGYYDAYMQMMHHAADTGFVNQKYLDGIVVVRPDAQSLFEEILVHVPPKGLLEWSYENI